MAKKCAIVRTDASAVIGAGHVMRCLALADTLRENGIEVFFICREHEGNLCGLIRKRGFVVYGLHSPGEKNLPEDDPAYSSWLGSSWEEDAKETCEIIKKMGLKPDWVIVDHYALDYRWECKIRPLVKKIFVIDDVADRNHECDFLLDQTLAQDMRTRYPGKVPRDCILLLGPEYALLQPEYAELHDRIPPKEGPVKRILISFGGTDRENITGRTLSAVISMDRPELEVDVVVSDNCIYRSDIESLAAGQSNIHLHSNMPTLAYLMAEADLAIGAAGTTSWERLCLGLPSVVVTLADNQVAIAEGLKSEGLIVWLGNVEDVSKECIRQSLFDIIDNNLIKEISVKCRNRVDGKGTKRTATVLTLNQETPLNIHKVRLSDEELLLKWVNDPLTRKNSFSSEYISPTNHHEWFCKKMKNPDECSIYIIETNNETPVGQVRFDRDGAVWEIDYSVASEFRRRNLGKKVLEMGLSSFRLEHKGVLVVGNVKDENLASGKVFESLEFDLDLKDGVKRYHKYLV